MGKIFYIMGKSASGKDTVYEELLSEDRLKLRPLIMYTTRPIRARETDGVEYHFVDEAALRRMQEEGRVIELRSYDTIHGIWYYFTADGDSVDLEQNSYLALGTLDSYRKIRSYYGRDRVIPVYIEAADDLRLERSIRRERKQAEPNYAEVCRRFLADQEDFSEERLREAEITRRFLNNEDRRLCMEEIAGYIMTWL